MGASIGVVSKLGGPTLDKTYVRLAFNSLIVLVVLLHMPRQKRFREP